MRPLQWLTTSRSQGSVFFERASANARAPRPPHTTTPARFAALRHLRRGRGLRLGLLSSPGLGCTTTSIVAATVADPAIIAVPPTPPKPPGVLSLRLRRTVRLCLPLPPRLRLRPARQRVYFIRPRSTSACARSTAQVMRCRMQRRWMPTAASRLASMYRSAASSCPTSARSRTSSSNPAPHSPYCVLTEGKRADTTELQQPPLPRADRRRHDAEDPLVELDRLPHDLDRDGELPLRDAGDLGAVVVRVGADM